MTFTLDGKSEHGVHEKRKIGLLEEKKGFVTALDLIYLPYTCAPNTDHLIEVQQKNVSCLFLHNTFAGICGCHRWLRSIFYGC